jgi:hypothetical protein
MNVLNSPLIDELCERYREALGDDYEGYRNHCLRVFNFCCALAGETVDAEEKIAIAALFHDLGIWSSGTFDYIIPSLKLARCYLEERGKTSWCEEIETMIGEHHKLSGYKPNPSWLVEKFRKADLIDLSGGLVRFRLPDDFVTDVLDEFPNAGFHKKLLALII